MKTVTTTMLLAILLAVAGCGKQDDSDKEKRPPRVSLHMAALQGNLNAIRKHIGADSDLNKKDAYGSSPLIVAATFGKTETARALIDAGADMTYEEAAAAPYGGMMALSILRRVDPLEQTAEAHRYIEKGLKKGHVVITVEHSDKT